MMALIDPGRPTDEWFRGGMSGMRWSWGLTAGIAVLGSLVGLSHAVAAAATPKEEAFYRNRVVRVVVGFPPGGGSDAYARLLAPHLGRHLPGSPTVVVESMPGAGSLVAANFLYRIAPPDGLTIGHFEGNLLLAQVVGRRGIAFDGRRFAYLGALTREGVACALARARGITSVEAWAAAPTALKLGGTAPGTSVNNAARLAKVALGLPVQVVAGYRGTAEIRLAVESGELDGVCFNWASMRTSWRDALEGRVVVLLQVAPRPLPGLAHVPLAVDLARTEEARRLVEVALHDQSAMARPFVLPPGVPRIAHARSARRSKPRSAIRRSLADAQRAGLDVDPVPGEEIQRLVERLFNLSPAVVDRLRIALFE